MPGSRNIDEKYTKYGINIKKDQNAQEEVRWRAGKTD